ncbi:RED-like protein N-terminal region-domain-containing protein [Russula aff. rugulosa BPL654]|nr:RED-like protein N-terminal region-domain-containing protein [Russula aff. rugulosa BPL654]
MNQDAFKSLLQTERPASVPSTTSRGSFLSRGTKPGQPKGKAISPSVPAFKPRKLKKASEDYRDRAEERRAGKEGDYAQVEALLEEFEKKNAENEDRAAVEEQRRYLGGDSDHSILVKGLDFALLEQNKARLASTSSKQDDEALEEVFAQKASTLSAPTSTKRSRADIIKELKEKRVNEGGSEQSKEEAVAEKPPDSSKFRPIGFKPIGTSTEEKIKRKKKKEGSEPKKKKRKVESSTVDAGEKAVERAAPRSALTKPIEAETAEDDFDIFADAGEYKGVDVGSDDDDDENKESETGHERPSHPGPSVASTADASPPLRRGWFDKDAAASEPEPEPEAPKAPAEQPTPIPEAGEAEEERLARLAPLTSSAMPSIRDFLAMDEAVEKEEKRKARKEKRKGKNKDS